MKRLGDVKFICVLCGKKDNLTSVIAWEKNKQETNKQKAYQTSKQNT